MLLRVTSSIGTKNYIAGMSEADWEVSPNQWRPVVFPETTSRLACIQDKLKQHWYQFRCDQINQIHPYQKQNIDEFFAVGFEVYIENPAYLKEKQPRTYSILKDLLS